MDKIIKLLLFLVLAFNSTIEAFAMEPESVTFRGAITRHALTDKSIEVSGVIRFYYTDNEYIDEPFMILAGNQSVEYSKTLPWDLAGSLETDAFGEPYMSHDYFLVDIICQINCEKAGLYSKQAHYMENGSTSLHYNTEDGTFFPERFGEDERDNAYIANLTLIPRYFTLAVDIKLPYEDAAQEDIPLTFISEDYHFSGGSAYWEKYNVKINSHVIKKGQTSGRFNILFDLEDDPYMRLEGDKLFFGYQCLSSACERADLLQEAWLVEAQNEFFSDASSAVAFEVISYIDNGDYYLELPQSLELLSRNNSVEVKLSRNSKSIKQAIEGNFIVEKLFYRNYCDDGYAEIDYTQNNVCAFPILILQSGLVSTTKFSLSEGELDTVLAINIETIKTNRAFRYYVGSYRYPSDAPHQTIRFECTSGCENSQIKSGYLNENGKFSAGTISQAKKFYQTEDFYQDELILNLIRPPLIMPMLDLLMEEEASD